MRNLILLEGAVVNGRWGVSRMTGMALLPRSCCICGGLLHGWAGCRLRRSLGWMRRAHSILQVVLGRLLRSLGLL